MSASPEPLYIRVSEKKRQVNKRDITEATERAWQQTILYNVVASITRHPESVGARGTLVVKGTGSQLLFGVMTALTKPLFNATVIE